MTPASGPGPSRSFDSTYNGWPNYPTWAVFSWLTNEEASYTQFIALGRQYADTSDTVLSAHLARYVVRTYYDGRHGPASGGLRADVPLRDLGRVDWTCLARRARPEANQ